MLKAKLQEQQIVAQKSGDKALLDTLRYILSRVKNKEIEVRHEATDEVVVETLRRVRRELLESIESFQKGGRSDLAAQSQVQLEVVNSYLPKEMSDEELEKEVLDVIEKNAELAKANPKAIIGIAVKELKDKADTSRIVKAVQSLTNQ